MGELVQFVGLSNPRMSDAEEEIAALPRGAAQNSFRVFAEWLKDNRRSIEQRFDALDDLLVEIRHEVKRTNGRVTDLEKGAELSKALADGREEWSSEAQAGQEKKARLWEGRAKTVLGFLGGGIAGAVGHVVGLW